MKNFSIEEIVKATGGTLVSGDMEYRVSGLSTDSRKVKESDIFFPLRGENTDGHNYLGQVIEAGCRTIIFSDITKLPQGYEDCGELNLIQVADTASALQELSKYYLDTLHVKKKIAVTGSVGKTSTRDMTYFVSQQKYRTGRNPKNFNNYYGLPLTLLEFPEDTEIAVLEMGMASKGEIETLARIVRPEIAIITNVGVSHIENLGTREGILEAKLEVTTCFDKNCTLIVNSDNDMLKEENVRGDYKLITVGSDLGCDYRVSDVCDYGDKGIKFSLYHDGKEYSVELEIPGAHNAINATLAIAAGQLIGISIDDAVRGLQSAELTEKRLNIKNKGRIKVIDDTYNACPESVRSALNTLVSTETESGGRRIAILGDMYELGDESREAHLDTGRFAGEKNIDMLIAVGKDARYYAEGAQTMAGSVLYYEDKQKLIDEINDIVRPGDVVLAKASRGVELEDVVREIIRDKE